MRCHIRIKGHLDPSWQDWFEGLEIVQEEEGTTLFSGPLQDLDNFGLKHQVMFDWLDEVFDSQGK